MKKYLNWLIAGSLAIFLTFFVSKVQADVDYGISDMNVTAKVNRDGSLTMTRKIYYDFDSDAHGVYYRQNLNKNQSLSNIKVAVDNKAVQPSNSGKNNTYQLTHSKNSYRFKVFHNIEEDDRVKVEYSYKILNAITNYKDTAELNFKIIGDGWDTDIDQARAAVIFPGKVPGLKAWAHGPLNGYTQVLPKKGKIIMTVDDLAGDVGIEVHAIFPTRVTSANMNFVNQNKKRTIEKQEARLAGEANRKRQRRSRISIGLFIISLLSGIWVIGRGFFSKKKGYRPQRMRNLVHNYEIPSVTPVAAQILDDADKPDTHAFTAYLMQLAGKHKIKIEQFKTKRLKKTAYRITLVDKNILKDEFLAFIFQKVGDGQSFTTLELKNYTSKKLSRAFDDWCAEQYDAVVDQGYLDNELEQARSRFGTISIVGIIISVIAWIVALVMANSFAEMFGFFILIGLIAIALEIVAVFVGNRKFSIYTQKGAAETNQVRGFEKMLDDIGNFKMKDVGDLILWEDIMPYAVAFGLSKKVLKQLKIEFGTEELASSSFIYYSGFYAGRHSFESSFERSFSEGVSTGSSTSGSSGGFSGGSSGGFGGGSGGGAF